MFLKHVSSTASFVRRLLLSSRPLSSPASASLAADKLFTPLTNPSDAQTCYGLPYLRIPATFFPPAPTSVFVSSSSPESFLASPSSKVSSFLVAEVFDTPSAFHRKFEEEGYNVVGGLCKRLVEEDVDITKEDALELDVPNPGARKGRKWTKVVAAEAGGIMQGIGAYMVQVSIDGKIQSCVLFEFNLIAIVSVYDNVINSQYSGSNVVSSTGDIETYRMYICGTSNDLRVALSVTSWDEQAYKTSPRWFL